jgi:hypothetical protein
VQLVFTELSLRPATNRTFFASLSAYALLVSFLFLNGSGTLTFSPSCSLCMKTLRALAASLALATLLLPARAQTPATTHANPKPAQPAQPAPKPTTQRGMTDKQTPTPAASKVIGRKFVEKSKPADMLRTPIR